NATFHELYALLKPAATVRERADQQWKHMWRMFKARGLDSTTTIDTIMRAIDTNMDYKILYNEYRGQFSAEELQLVLQFFKSLAGKRYLEAEPRLFAARTGAVDQYIRSTINSITTPMLMTKGLPPQSNPGMPAPPPRVKP